MVGSFSGALVGSILVLGGGDGPADGAALYREHCASCHGKEGGGDGVLANDLRFKPRAFKEGKFAFGNTADAMAKTVMSGIPGQDMARMPAFKSVLSEAEIEAVVAYVRTLMPEQPELTPADMEMEPRDRALIVRGILAPLRRGEKPLARGLLVGLPSGFSFEYATETVQLVAVRRGAYLRRSDWEGRGGRPLTPLGTPLWLAPEPAEWTPFALGAPPPEGEHAEWKVALAKLRETCVRGARVELKYDLVDLDGRVRAHVLERPREIVMGGMLAGGPSAPAEPAETGTSGSAAAGGYFAGGNGIVQELEILATDEPVAVMGSIAIGSDPKLALPAPADLAAAIPAGSPPLVRHSSEQMGVMGATGWWLVRPPDGSYVCVRIDAPADAIVSNYNGESHDCVDFQVVVRDEPVIVRRTIVFRPDATLELLQAMTRELTTTEATR